VTNPGHAAQLFPTCARRRDNNPDEFQLVIRATFQSNVPVGIQYVTHHANSSP
jgi:hypothetical protein